MVRKLSVHIQRMIISHYGSWRHTSSNELQSLQYPELSTFPKSNRLLRRILIAYLPLFTILTSHTLLTAGYLVYVPNFNDVRGFSCICVMVTARFAARLSDPAGLSEPQPPNQRTQARQRIRSARIARHWLWRLLRSSTCCISSLW